jgi:hypothetical protein
VASFFFLDITPCAVLCHPQFHLVLLQTSRMHWKPTDIGCHTVTAIQVSDTVRRYPVGHALRGVRNSVRRGTV